MKAVDLLGYRFGAFTVVGTVQTPGRRLWLCRCDCGTERPVAAGNLKSGDTTNCGCQRSQRRGAAHRSHGGSLTNGARPKEYRTWCKLVARCTYPTDKAYSAYGGRGITVDPRWLASYQAFLDDMGAAPSPSHSIDRIDNERGYSPDNCRWATPREQSRNTRRTIMIEGVCLKDYCDSRGLSYSRTLARIARGHPLEVALSSRQGANYRALYKATLAASPT